MVRFHTSIFSKKSIKQEKPIMGLCEKLESFEKYKACGYQKAKLKCNNQEMIEKCPVPKHVLLKGVLNIKAYSFYFYVKDQCQGDLLTHFDDIIAKHFNPGDGSGLVEAKNHLITDFTKVFGVGQKLANITLSYLLCADPEETQRVRLGPSYGSG